MATEFWVNIDSGNSSDDTITWTNVDFTIGSDNGLSPARYQAIIWNSLLVCC